MYIKPLGGSVYSVGQRGGVPGVVGSVSSSYLCVLLSSSVIECGNLR